MAGAFHGVGEPANGHQRRRVAGRASCTTRSRPSRAQPFDVVAETVKKTAFQYHAHGAARRAGGQPAGSMRPSASSICRSRRRPPSATRVARILEEMGLEVCGTHGTTAALALLNDAVKKGGVMASSSRRRAFRRVHPRQRGRGHDRRAAACGALTLDKLEAMTCVCSVGLDMIAVPGDTSAETISAIIADEAAIGMVNSKTTAVRLIPAPNCKVGDTVEFGGLLGSAPVHAGAPVFKCGIRGSRRADTRADAEP